MLLTGNHDHVCGWADQQCLRHAALAQHPRQVHTTEVPAWSSYSYFFGPLVAGLTIGVFILLLRWTFARGTSVVAAPPKRGAETDYGLLVVVSRPGNDIDGEIQRRTLAAAGIKATLVPTVDGPRLMVWPGDEQRARELIAP